MLGRTINGHHGHYKLIDVRGSGSMATVYVSRDLDSNRLFAVKVLRPEIANQGEFLERFHREAQLLMVLTDPHIVCPVEYGADGDLHYLVMDYVDGATLKEQIIASAPFLVERAIDVALQAAEGLQAAFMHPKQVVHRDVKPQNILVTTKNVVKLTDFGMARAWESVTLTDPNVFMGTPFYVAPEQANDGRNADIRSDLYSLACVLFEMVTGQVPYDGITAVDVIMKHVRNPIPSVRTVRPDLPAALDSFLQQAMAKAPAQRFQTPQEFRQKLEELQQQQRSAALPPSVALLPDVEGPRLTLLATGQVIYLTGNQALIGRHDPHQQIYPEVDLSTLDTGRMVSRRQARLLQHDGRYFVEDLGALNVTRLNGTPLRPHEERALAEGDILRAGNIEIRFSLRQR